jgi:hypothetical protein
VEETAVDFMIEATGVQKVYAAGGLRVRALRGLTSGSDAGRWSPLWVLPDPGRPRCLTFSPASTTSPTASPP